MFLEAYLVAASLGGVAGHARRVPVGRGAYPQCLLFR